MKTKLSRFAAVLAAAALLVTAISCKTPEDATVEKETAATPVITVADNSVTITCATEGATIYYTTDGSDPTADSSVYSSPIALTETVTVKAFAAADGYDDSETAEKECEYVKPVTATPVITDSDNTVTITCETEDAVIYYTTDGTDPTAESTKYEAAFPVTASVTVKAIATKAGYTDSEVASAEVEYVAPGTVGTPKITQDVNTVTITCATTGATIYYTTDGSEPTTASTKYTAAITLTKDITIKAFAVKADCTDSAVATQSCTYVIPKVTVKFMNGTEEVDSKTVNSGTKVTAPAAPTKTGYTFGGWKAGSVTLAASTESAAITADTTFEAVWTAITYTIKFDANGGSGKVASITATYDQDVTLADNTYTSNAPFEDGWNTTADGTGTAYASGASVKNLASTAGAEITLYAQWTFIISDEGIDLSTWSGSAKFDASVFTNITTSTLLCIKYTIGDESYQCFNIKDLTYTDFSGLSFNPSSSGAFVFSLTDDALTYAQENGIIVQGYNMVIQSFEVLDNTYYLSWDDGSSTDNVQLAKTSFSDNSENYTTVNIVLYNTSDGSRGGYGNLTINTCNSSDSWKWTKMDASYWDSDTYTLDQYGQFVFSSFDAETSITLEIPLSTLLENCTKADDGYDYIVFAPSNDASVTAVYLSN